MLLTKVEQENINIKLMCFKTKTKKANINTNNISTEQKAGPKMDKWCKRCGRVLPEEIYEYGQGRCPLCSGFVYHKHQPFQCPDCQELNFSLVVLETYDTLTGCDGNFEVCCECGYRLEYEESESMGFFDNKGRRYESYQPKVK